MVNVRRQCDELTDVTEARKPESKMPGPYRWQRRGLPGRHGRRYPPSVLLPAALASLHRFRAAAAMRARPAALILRFLVFTATVVCRFTRAQGAR